MATPPPNVDRRGWQGRPRRRRAAAAPLLAAFTLISFGALVPATPGAGAGSPARGRRRSGEAQMAVVGSARAERGPTGPTAGTGPSRPSAPALPVRYRVVGCRSRGNVAYRSGPPRREVAIGFDDGPSSDTLAFARMLERARAQATFFMIGRQITAGYKGTLMRELRDGDVLGDHTFTHPELTDTRNVRGQLESTIQVIRSLTGYTPCVFRPPYGAYDRSIVRTARSLGLATVLWNVDPSDWALPGASAINQRVLAQVQPGSIIISHDGGGPRGETLAAYPSIIAALRARRYRIVTIPQLLGFRPVYTPCTGGCDGIGMPRTELPGNAILEQAPKGSSMLR